MFVSSRPSIKSSLHKRLILDAFYEWPFRKLLKLTWREPDLRDKKGDKWFAIRGGLSLKSTISHSSRK